jgi:hypothetical protein
MDNKIHLKYIGVALPSLRNKEHQIHTFLKKIRIMMKLILCTCLLHTATVTVPENAVLMELLITKYTPTLKYV